MTDVHDTDGRLTDLEIKVSFTEDLVERLNETVARQQAQIDLLMRELTRLSHQLANAAPQAPGNLSDDLPPHY